MNISHHASLLALALMACACRVSTLAVPLAPPGVHVRPEVARGYLTYQAPLAAYGDWVPDRDYGVHWCPSAASVGGPGATFQPYVSRGHWDLSEVAMGRAPAGSPVWRSEDSDTWGEITSHHGWWVPVAGRGDSAWCWVPGLEETPARVAWREDDEFVGWAPELPFWIAVDDADYDDGLDWVFTLLGTLTDGSPGDNLLSGRAREQARAATGPSRRSDGSFQAQRVGPSGTSIGAAKKALADYVIKHPDAIAAATATQAKTGPSGSSGSRSKSSSSSSSGKKSEGKDGVTMTAGVAPAPYAMTYYDAFQVEPLAGPAGVSARGGAGGEAVAAGGAGGAGGRSGEGASAGRGGGEARSASLHGAGATAGTREAEHPGATAATGGHSYSYSSSSGRSSKGRSSKSGRSGRSHR